MESQRLGSEDPDNHRNLVTSVCDTVNRLLNS